MFLTNRSTLPLLLSVGHPSRLRRSDEQTFDHKSGRNEQQKFPLNKPIP
jgi:hypothetical protein